MNWHRQSEERSSPGSSLRYLLLAPDGRRLGGDLAASSTEPGWHDVVIPHAAHSDDGEHVVRAFATRMGNGAVLMVGDSLEPLEEIEREVLQAFGWTFGATLIVALRRGAPLSPAWHFFGRSMP